MMNEGDDDTENKPAPDENAGPKIKMGRIGKKKKKGQAGGREGAREGGAAADSGFSKPTASAPDEDDRGNEGFTEQDIEFMRQAI